MSTPVAPTGPAEPRQIDGPAFPRVCMLVSANAGVNVREEVRRGLRPRSEFLVLEERYGVKVLDWSRLGVSGGRRSFARSLRHVGAALRSLDSYDVVFSDGEHVGIPMALAMLATSRSRPHLVVGHNVLRSSKRHLIRMLARDKAISCIVVHSREQLHRLTAEVGLSPTRVTFIPYGIDTDFWRPLPVEEEALVLSPGRERRDHHTLSEACQGLRETVFITGASAHSPHAKHREPVAWPSNFARGAVDYAKLRDLYARSRVVVIPLLDSGFAAGITTLLEAMAMGKAVVVTGTPAMTEVVQEDKTALVVRPGDPGQMQQAIRYLIAHPEVRERMGQRARKVVGQQYSLDVFVEALAAQLHRIAPRTRSGS
jgi:glycosyltransferase involved in cell wall biosynthesis